MTRRSAPAESTRVILATSAGGHLAQLLRLEEWYRDVDATWVTFDLPDAVSALAAEKVVWAHHPTTRNVKNLLRNSLLAVRTLRRVRPHLVVSSGAAIAVPFFWLGKLFGAHTIYVEVVDRIDTRTLTARLVYPVTDVFLVQDHSQVALFPDSIFIGELL
jgi:beta-1,4-N-acetylglucosaminyltransferase